MLSNLDYQSLTPQQREWIIKAVTGAIYADEFFHKEERKRFQGLLEFLGDDKEMIDFALESIRKKSNPVIDPITVDEKTALEFFKIVVDLCASDMLLHPLELNYIRKLGRKLKIPHETCDEWIKKANLKIRFEYFIQFVKELKPEQRCWLAAVVVRLIYADEKIDADEYFYLGHIYDLLEDMPEFMENLKKNMKNFDMNKLPEVSFEQNLAQKIFLYLIEITMRSDYLEPKGLQVAKEASEMMGLEEEFVQEVVKSVEELL